MPTWCACCNRRPRRKVGLLRYDTVARGRRRAVRDRIAALRGDGVRFAVADAIGNDDLRTLAQACADLPLITAGSGVALGLPEVYAERGWLVPDAQAAALDPLSAARPRPCRARVRPRPMRRSSTGSAPGGPASGSMRWRWRPEKHSPSRHWTGPSSDSPTVPVLVYATAAPEQVREVQAALGTERAGTLVERCLSRIAAGLVEGAGVRRLVVAGGETSGAVVQALGVHSLRIGATIDPGVPWTRAEGRPLLLALKSGNFGSADFFTKALAQVH